MAKAVLAVGDSIETVPLRSTYLILSLPMSRTNRLPVLSEAMPLTAANFEEAATPRTFPVVVPV